jgi:hypothetical protein
MHMTSNPMPSDETLAARDEEDRAAYHEAQAQRKTWHCWIGEVAASNLPSGADGHMREHVERAYRELLGRVPDFIFSGWGDPLPEPERAVHEDREPDIEAQLAELRPVYEMLVDEAQRQGKLSDPIARIDWIRRNVGRGEAPESWTVNDFVALAVVKLGDAVMSLNGQRPDAALSPSSRRLGREALLVAVSTLLDCWERYADAKGRDDA